MSDNRKEKKWKNLPGPYLRPAPVLAQHCAAWPGPTGQASHPHPCQEEAKEGTASARMHTMLLPACPAFPSALSTPESSIEPPGLSSLSPELSPLLCSSSLPRPNATAARRREPQRPSPPPRPLLLSRSTATLDYASSSSWTMPGALQRRHRRHPLRRSRGSPPLNSSPTGPPRAHRRRLRVCCELPFALPLAP